MNTSLHLLLVSANFFDGRIFPSTLEVIDYAQKNLNPKPYHTMAGSESTEFILYEVVETNEKYKNQGKIFCLEHRGDMFILKNGTASGAGEKCSLGMFRTLMSGIF